MHVSVALSCQSRDTDRKEGCKLRATFENIDSVSNRTAKRMRTQENAESATARKVSNVAVPDISVTPEEEDQSFRKTAKMADYV
jgi:hypothetical protein